MRAAIFGLAYLQGQLPAVGSAGPPSAATKGDVALLADVFRSRDKGSVLVEAADVEEMVRLLSRHQDELFRYIFALLPHEEDARDVLQETSVALFRKVAEYDPAKPFLAWAYRFAYLEVLKQRERNQHAARFLRPDILERL